MNDELAENRKSGSIIDTIRDVRKKLFTGKKEMAAKNLLPVDGENRFFLKDGPSIASLYELVHTLRDMSDEQFGYHVNEDKNDFAEWVHHVIEDKKLAGNIRGVKDKHSMAMKVAERYDKLSRIIE